MDDIIITGDNTLEIEHLKGKLGATFEVKDLGELKIFFRDGSSQKQGRDLYISMEIHD